VKVFHCDHCGQLVFFENVTCTGCGRILAYLPDLEVVGSLEEPAEGDGLRSPLPEATGRYRLCANYTHEDVCNWAIPASEPETLCRSCRLTRTIPDLSQSGNKARWYKLEVAKRRLVHGLSSLNLPVRNRGEDAETGLAFDFLASGPDTVVVTGHARGVITIDIAEADDVQRETVRVQMGEPYRTLLGHFRHESGHYYWTLLVEASEHLAAFRALFGDERDSYSDALERHYLAGPPWDWQERFVTAYASVHPWEDWAETWAHYLHMADALETAAACGLSLEPRRTDEPALQGVPAAAVNHAFERLIGAWYPLTYLLNNLNRGIGQPDAYPFVLSAAAVEKLRFVHAVIQAAANA
jgi:hypothetical protein